MNADVFAYASEPQWLGTSGSRVGRVGGGVDSKDALMSALEKALELPGWFGRNWDALSDCLTDLEWVEEPRLVLFHDEMPGIPEVELLTYLEVLADAVESWSSSEGFELVVAFRPSEVRRVEGLLGG